MSNQFTWTDEKVKQFARVYASGRRGKYKNAKKIDDKMSIFKDNTSTVSSKTPSEKRGRPCNTLYVHKFKFLEWFFDRESAQDFFKNYGVGLSLMKKNRFRITMDDIVKSAGYIPFDVLSETNKGVWMDDDGEVVLSKYKNIKIVDK